MSKKVKIRLETPDGQKGMYKKDMLLLVMGDKTGDGEALELEGWQFPQGKYSYTHTVLALQFIADNLEADEHEDAQLMGKAVRISVDRVLEVQQAKVKAAKEEIANQDDNN